MRKLTSLLLASLAGGAVIAAGGACGPTYVIQRPAPPPLPLYGRVSIEVMDRREPKKGGADPSVIGNERSGWGIPSAIRVDGPGALPFELHDLFAQHAVSSQIGVLPVGQTVGATSRLIIEIQTYWCDGYPPAFKADAVASATVIDGATGQVRVPGQPITAHGDAGSCRMALRRMMGALASTARGMFATPQIHDALIAEPAGAPPQPAAAPVAPQQ
jgi:hypothetical protein